MASSWMIAPRHVVHAEHSCVTKQSGFLHLLKPILAFQNFYQFCASLPKVNWATTGLSVACIVVLLVFKLCINPPIVRKIRVPVPIELLIVSIILLGGFFRIQPNYKCSSIIRGSIKRCLISILAVLPLGNCRWGRLPQEAKPCRNQGHVFNMQACRFDFCVVRRKVNQTSLN